MWGANLSFFLAVLRRRPDFAIGYIIVGLIILLAIFAPLIAPFDPIKADPKVAKADPKVAKADPKTGGSIAGPLLRRKVDKKPVTEKPFLPKDKVKPDPEPGGTPIYKKWWFWTAIGAAVVAGVVTGTAVVLSGDEGIPSGKGRVLIDF